MQRLYGETIMKNIICFICFILLSTNVESKPINNLITEDSTYHDISGGNVKAFLSANMVEPFTQNHRGTVDFGYGYDFGLTVTIIKELDLLFFDSFHKFKTNPPYPDYNFGLDCNSLLMGLRLYPYRENFSFYLGGHFGYDFHTESLSSDKYHLDYNRSLNDMVIGFQLGGNYYIGHNIEIDFNIKGSTSLFMDRVGFHLGIIYDL